MKAVNWGSCVHVKTLPIISLKSSTESRRVVITVVIANWTAVLPSFCSTKQCKYHPGSNKLWWTSQIFSYSSVHPSHYLVPWSSCRLLTVALVLCRAQWGEVLVLSYLSLPPQTRFYSPCYCGHGKNTQKHFSSPLFIFYEQVDRYPSLMRTLIPVYIRHALKAKPIHFAEPGAREDCAEQYLKTGKSRGLRGCPSVGHCALYSRYRWSSPEGLDSAVTNGDRPVEGALIFLILLWCWSYFVFQASAACGPLLLAALVTWASLRVFLFPLQPFSTLLLWCPQRIWINIAATRKGTLGMILFLLFTMILEKTSNWEQ